MFRHENRGHGKAGFEPAGRRVENAHFGKRDFRVGKRIFMSLPEAGRAVFKFTPDQQRTASGNRARRLRGRPRRLGRTAAGPRSVSPMPTKGVIDNVMETAWRNVAPKTLKNNEETLQETGQALQETEEIPQKTQEPAE